jgi:hypothetical protein
MATTLTICSPGAVPSSLPQPSSATAEQECRRQYAPSVWGDFFITHQLCTPEELLSMQEKALANKEEVRRIVLDTATAATSGSDLVQKLDLVDALQPLGVDYHYKKARTWKA